MNKKAYIVKRILVLIILVGIFVGCQVSKEPIKASGTYINVVGKYIYYDEDYSAINLDLYLNYYFDFSGNYEITTHKIEGSNDGINWAEIHVGASSTAPDHYREGKTRLCYRLNIKNGNGKYRYYRVDIGYCPVNDDSQFTHCTYDTTDIWQNQIVDLNGFSKEADGWPITNMAECFGYSSALNADSSMPKERLAEVYDINILKGLYNRFPLFNWVMDSFKGYCYGMALTAIAEYNNQIDLSKELNSGTHRLNGTAFNLYKSDISDNTGTYQYYTLKTYKNVVKLIEQCFLAQGSKEMYNVEVFKPSSEKEYYGELIEYLSNVNNAPLLVTCFHHAMVLETASKPIESSDGWVKLSLYDVNYPSDVNYINSKYLCYNYESELWVNTKNGNAKYVNAYNQIPIQICSRENIHFFDPSRLSNSFFSFSGKLHFSNETSYFGNYENLEIIDESGKTVFKSEDGEILYKAEECQITEWINGDEDSQLSIIGFDQNKFKIMTQENEFALISSDSLVSINMSGEGSCSIDMTECEVEISSGADNNVEIAIQDELTSDEPTAIMVNADMKQEEVITIVKNDVETWVKSINNITADISLDNNKAIKVFEDVPIRTISDINVEDFQIHRSINVIEIGSIDPIIKSHGTSKTEEALGLPPKINIILDNGTSVDVDILWDLENLVGGIIYDPTLEKVQEFKINGFVKLPEGIDNAYDKKLVCQVTVAIEGAEKDMDNSGTNSDGYIDSNVNKTGDKVHVENICLFTMLAIVSFYLCVNINISSDNK